MRYLLNKDTSLSVLERNVWLAILGALVVTAIMIWLLDK